MEKETIEKKRWWQYRGMGRKECGKVALVGLAGFVICYSFGVIGGIADIFGLVSWVAGILWIIKTIQYKKDLKRRIKKRLQELQIDPDKDYQAYYKIVREEEDRFDERFKDKN